MTLLLKSDQLATASLGNYYLSGAKLVLSPKRYLVDYGTGPCFRVRRSSDSTELNINYLSSGLVDTSALLTFCGAGDGFVVKNYDHFGGGYHAVQATAANQPKIVSAGVLVTDGSLSLPAMSFTAAQVGSLVAPYSLATASWSLVTVASFSGFSADGSACAVGNIQSGAPYNGILHDNHRSDGTASTTNTGAGPTSTSTDRLTNVARRIAITDFDGTGILLSRNGTETARRAAAYSAHDTSLTIGRYGPGATSLNQSSALNFQFLAVMPAMSAARRASLTTWLNQQFGVF